MNTFHLKRVILVAYMYGLLDAKPFPKNAVVAEAASFSGFKLAQIVSGLAVTCTRARKGFDATGVHWCACLTNWFTVVCHWPLTA